jgi:phosphoglycerate dehydrogenase-like enzyme
VTAVRRPLTVLAMDEGLQHKLFTPTSWTALTGIAEIDPDQVLTDFAAGADRLAEAEVLLTGWGCPRVDTKVLDAAPHLRAIVHAAGSVKGHLAPEVWERGLVVSTAAAANALPVAEYALGAILLAGKGVPWIAREYAHRQAAVDLVGEYPLIGNYRRTVGIIGASRIGRRVIELLATFELDVVLHDPFLTADQAAALGAELVSLEDLLTRADVVSVHAPQIPATYHLLDAPGLARMRDGATLINTARGSLIDQDALITELVSGRINAVLDTTDPEITPAGSPLYTLPNVLLTPHLAGSAGVELRRMGDSAVDELTRYAAGKPFRHPVTLAELERIA